MLMPTETLNTDLVELEDIEKVKKLPVLLIVLQFHVVLLQPVQRQLGLVIHEDLHRLREGGWGQEEGRVGGLNLGGWRTLISNTPHGLMGRREKTEAPPTTKNTLVLRSLSSASGSISISWISRTVRERSSAEH